MGDGRAEGARLRAFGIDVNPLPVAGHFGEAVDARLVDRRPAAGAEREAVFSKQIARAFKDRGHFVLPPHPVTPALCRGPGAACSEFVAPGSRDEPGMTPWSDWRDNGGTDDAGE